MVDIMMGYENGLLGDIAVLEETTQIEYQMS